MGARADGSAGAGAAGADDVCVDYAVVGGTGKLGFRVVERLIARDSHARVRCLVRDATAPRAAALAALDPSRVVLVEGDATDADARAELLPARVVVSTAGTVGRYRGLGDVLRDPAEHPDDVNHPYWINFRAQASLAREAAATGACRRFVRVTGLSAGRSAASPFAALFNVVACGTVRWQLEGERAIRESGTPYVILRPGALKESPGAKDNADAVLLHRADDGPKAPGGAVGITRDALADVIVAATESDANANVTLSAVFEKREDEGTTAGGGASAADWRAAFAAAAPDVAPVPERGAAYVRWMGAYGAGAALVALAALRLVAGIVL